MPDQSTPTYQPRRLANLRHAIASMPWAIVEDKLQAILDVVEFHAAGGTYTPEQLQEITAAVEARAARASSVAPEGGKIAVVPMYGTITQRADLWSAMSGSCSTEDIGAALDQAMADPAVGAIVIDCDSPGGTISGVPELAARLAGMRGQGKRLIAVANGLMASAAYWICSAADEIVVTPSGDVGSIGVFCVHTDISGADEKLGVKRTIVRAGKYKAEGNMYEPLSDDAKAALEQSVADAYEMFVADVARGRGVTADAVKSGYGEGRCLTAKRAVAAGLADRVATLEDVLADLGAPNRGLSGRGAKATDTAPARAASIEIRGASDAGAVVTAETVELLGGRVQFGAVAERVLAKLAATLTTTTNTVDAGDGAPAVASSPPVTEHTMPHPAGAAPAGAGTDSSTAAEVVAAERERSREIRALGREHGLDEAQIDAIADSGVDINAASRQILAIQRAARANAPVVRVGNDRAVDKPWASKTEFFGAVIAADSPTTATSPDVRLFAGPTGMGQAVPSEGGFLVPPTFAQEIWDGVNAEPDSLLAQTDSYPVEGESVTFNANAETSRATGSRFGGVQAYWLNEADAATPSKPKFRQARVEPQEIAALVYLTDKLLRNAPATLGPYVTRAASSEIDFMVGAAIWAGTGAGQPQGMFTSPSLITVNKETSQAAGTILQENISKMWARLHPRARAGASWYINADVEPALDTLNSVVKNVAGTENVGGYANKVFDAEKRTLKGRPIKVVEYAESLGTKGDIVLWNPQWYLTGVAASGIQQAVSMHVRFLNAEQALRFMFAVDGQPWLAAAQTPFKGANTLSSHVALQSR